MAGLMKRTNGDPMARLSGFSVLLRRIGGRGALDNVTDVLSARARVDAEVALLEARVAQRVRAA